MLFIVFNKKFFYLPFYTVSVIKSLKLLQFGFIKKSFQENVIIVKCYINLAEINKIYTLII